MTMATTLEIESVRIDWLRREGLRCRGAGGDTGEPMLYISRRIDAGKGDDEDVWFTVDMALDLPTEEYICCSGIDDGKWWISLPMRVVESYSKQVGSGPKR